MTLRCQQVFSLIVVLGLLLVAAMSASSFSLMSVGLSRRLDNSGGNNKTFGNTSSALGVVVNASAGEATHIGTPVDAVAFMRTQCGRSIPEAITAQLLRPNVTNVRYSVALRSLVCIHNATVYIDLTDTGQTGGYGIALKERVRDLVQLPAGAYKSLHEVLPSDVITEFLDAGEGRDIRYVMRRVGAPRNESSAAVRDELLFHPSIAVVNSAMWNSVNYFHMTHDGFNPMMHWMETFAGGSTSLAVLGGEAGGERVEVPHVVVQTGEEHFLFVENKKSPCATCAAFASGLVEAPSRGKPPRRRAYLDSIVIDGSVKRQVPQCFCSGVMFGANGLRTFGPERQLGSLSMKVRLVRYFGAVPYGAERVPLTELRKFGYFSDYIETSTLVGTGNMSRVPRLVFVNRHKRKIGNTNRLQAIARDVGFHVTTVYFEELTPPTQFHLSRYADVLVGIHGMALTYVANMDGTGRWAQCRTLIELMHWVAPEKFTIYQEMAALNNVTHSKLIPNGVIFGPSVKDPPKEMKLLLKPKLYWWSLNGFDDQSAFFHKGQFARELKGAMQRYLACPAFGGA